MNEEEKEAINKTLKETIDIYEKYYSDNTEMLPRISEDYKMAKTTLNYIEKLQKEFKESINAMLEFHRKARELEDLVNEIIKRIPLEDDEGNPTTTKENLLENLDIFFSEWERLEDKEDKLFELSSLNYIHKKKIKEKIKELENQVAQFIEDRENKHTDKEIIYARDILEEILEENK